MTSPRPPAIRVGLSAVIVAVEGDTPCVLAVPPPDVQHAPALPFGPFDPLNHRTFELGLRGWVIAQTGFGLDYVEQLYTFGDRGRELPEATLSDEKEDARVVSVGYLALMRSTARPEAPFAAAWNGWYDFFPWEDHRTGRPAAIDTLIRPALLDWASDDEERAERIDAAFPAADTDWPEDRVLLRYELLYEAGLVPEHARDSARAEIPLADPPPASMPGLAMASDHRRILATAITRLRGKLRYRPIIFQLMPERFALSELQRTVEAVLGLALHKQNFRRALDKTGLVRGTGEMASGTGGRPAELFTLAVDMPPEQVRSGIATPIIRSD